MYDMRKILNTMAKYNGWNLTCEQMRTILYESHEASDDRTLYDLIHEQENAPTIEAREQWISVKDGLPDEKISNLVSRTWYKVDQDDLADVVGDIFKMLPRTYQLKVLKYLYEHIMNNGRIHDQTLYSDEIPEIETLLGAQMDKEDGEE